MKKLLAFLILLSAPAMGVVSVATIHGECSIGNTKTITQGLNSATLMRASYPQCLVTVYNHGGGLATLYSDSSLTPLSNPFTATTNGHWVFYAAVSSRYDVVLSGGLGANNIGTIGFPSPYTIADIYLSFSTGGGGTTWSLQHNGTLVGTEPILNVIDPPGTWTAADDPGNTRVNLQYTGSAGAGCDTTGLAKGDVLDADGTGGCEGDLDFIHLHTGVGGPIVEIGGDTGNATLEVDFDNHDNFIASHYLIDMTSTHAGGWYSTIDNSNIAGNGINGWQMYAVNYNTAHGAQGGLFSGLNGTAGSLKASGVEGASDGNNSVTSVSVLASGETTVASTMSANFLGRLICSDGTDNGVSSNCHSASSYKNWGGVLFGKLWTQDIQMQPEVADTTSLFGSFLTSGYGQTQGAMLEVACDSTQRGRIHYKNSTPDVIEVCENTTGVTYAWVALAASTGYTPAKVQTCTGKVLAAVDAGATSGNCVKVSSSYVANSVATTGGDLDTSTPTKVVTVNGNQVAQMLYNHTTSGGTAAQPDTNMHTVVADGQYRFTGDVNCATSVATATATLNIKWTDTSNTAQLQTVTATCTTLGASSVGELIFSLRAKAGTNITWGVVIANSPNYDCDVALETVNGVL